MKIAQKSALAAVMHGKDPMVVLRPNTAVVAQFRDRAHEAQEPDRQLQYQWSSRGRRQIDQIVLDKKECTIPFCRPCTSAWTPSTTSTKSKLNMVTRSVPRGRHAGQVVFYDNKAISVELPTSVEREITGQSRPSRATRARS
jgi:elongation factor P